MKVLPLVEAIERFVPDGASIVMGTALESLIPFAAGHALIRRERRELELIGPISDMLFDQLIGAGCVRRITAAWVGNVSAGLGHNYRRSVEHGIPRRVELEEHYYRAAHTKLLDLGLVPHLLEASTIRSLLAVADRYRDRVDIEAISPTVNWRRTASTLHTAATGTSRLEVLAPEGA